MREIINEGRAEVEPVVLKEFHPELLAELGRIVAGSNLRIVAAEVFLRPERLEVDELGTAFDFDSRLLLAVGFTEAESWRLLRYTIKEQLGMERAQSFGVDYVAGVSEPVFNIGVQHFVEELAGELEAACERAGLGRVRLCLIPAHDAAALKTPVAVVLAESA